jgi:hypothetical protein
VAYVCVGFGLVDVAPSPNVQLYVSGAPSGSFEPVLEKVTVRGGCPLLGLASTTATGGWLLGAYLMRLIAAGFGTC